MAGRPPPRREYADSCIFIEWLDPNTTQDLTPIEELFEDFKARRVMLFTSVITRIEVMRERNTEEAYQKFLNLIGDPYFGFVSADLTVIDDSHEIRNQLLKIRDDLRKQRLGKITTSSLDSIHLASAFAAKCDVFYTLDGKNPKEERDRKLLPIRELEFGGRKLLIQVPECRPVTPPEPEAEIQPDLFAGLSEEEEDAPEPDDPEGDETDEEPAD